jgi:hypothetical protein
MMRPFLPIILLVGACGDNLSIEGVEQDPDFVEPEGVDVPDPVARLQPDVCSVRSWPKIAFASRDVDLAVSQTDVGAAVFTVDRAGGPLRGFAIDGRGMLVGDATGTVVRADAKYTATAASVVEGRLITASVAGENVHVAMHQHDLSASLDLGEVRGTMVADMPMLDGRMSRFAPVGHSAGMSAIGFDANWRPATSRIVSSSAPLSISAAPYADDAMLAWSTDRSCHTLRLAANVAAAQPFPCVGGRLAIDEASRTGMLVFEHDGQLMRSDIMIGGHNELANRAVLVGEDYAPRAPRVAFDGERYWVSYINNRNDVVVGFLEEDGSLASMALEGTQPEADGYELAVIEGRVWLFAVDGAGVGAQRLCVKPAS